MAIEKQIVLTLSLLVFSIILFGTTDIDIWVQDLFFDFDTKEWLLNRDLEPFKFIFYDGIKKLLILFAGLFLLTLLFFRKLEKVREYKQGIIIVVLSAILIPMIAGGLKKSTNMPCPKNEIHYGGDMIKTAVWEEYPPLYKNKHKIACWPAGHASGGFALLSLFFLFKSRRNKVAALVSALAIGWSMGVYKMIIGDHFLSHTIITMFLAWLIVLVLIKLTQKTPVAKRENIQK